MTTHATKPPALSRSAVAITLVLAYGLLGAVLVGMPLTEIARVYYGGHPQGDGPLAEPGGLALGDLVLGRGVGALSAALPTSIVLAVLVAGGAHLPFGALLVHLSRQRRHGTLREAYAHSAARFFVLGSASLVSLAARAVITLLALLAAQAVAAFLHGKLDDRAADVSGLVTLLPFGALLFVLHVVTDLTYVGVAAHDFSLAKAIVSAVRTFRSKRRAVVGPALFAYAGSLVAIAVAGGTVGFFAIASNAGLVFLVHQGALLTKLLLRARWLSVAIVRTTAEDPLGPPSMMARDLVVDTTADAPLTKPAGAATTTTSDPTTTTSDATTSDPTASADEEPAPVAQANPPVLTTEPDRAPSKPEPTT